MKKAVWPAVIAVCIIIAVIVGVYVMGTGNKRTAIGEKSRLKTEGRSLVTQDGKTVLLRGTNLGGWLVQESWMCPVNKPDKGWANWDTLETFRRRGFTEEQIQKLTDTYQDHWITEWDLDQIMELGLNCVRVPFWYRNFQSDDRGTYFSEENMDQNPGFRRLDWVIKECGERGIYVILDMHGAPGFQSDDHCSGKTGSSLLFEDTEEGSYYRGLTVELWQRIAKRYQDEPAVAAYDLLNEPMNGFDPGRKRDKVLWDFYDELYKAVREIDSAHVISMEGIWEMYNLPAPSEYGWENVLYQTHNYNWNYNEIDKKVLDVQDRADWNVPVLVGEFQSEGIWDYTLSAYNKAGMSWTTWTYKGARNTPNGWFLYCSNTIPLVDPDEDSYEEIIEKWSAVGTTEKAYIRDDKLAEVLKKYGSE